MSGGVGSVAGPGSIGLDVPRDFCEVAISEGGKAHSVGRVETMPEQLELFAGSLGPDDRVVLEATGNALAILRIPSRTWRR
jgi:transposase